MTPRGLQIHTHFRRLDRERSEHLAVLADHRHGHADDAREIFLTIERDLLLPNLPQFRVKPRTVGDGGVSEAPELQTLQQAAPARRGGKREIELANGTA